MAGLIGTKLGMTRVILEDGKVIPVTAISVTSSIVTQLKTEEKDGYSAVVLGYNPLKKPRKTKKYKTLKEFRFDDTKDLAVGKELGLETMKEVKEVTLMAVSKGKGFAGVIKRHHFAGGKASHGSHGFHRRPGSVGMRAKPGKILKGKRLPGRMGNDVITLKNRPVIKVDEENKVLAIKGPIPGPNGNTVFISF